MSREIKFRAWDGERMHSGGDALYWLDMTGLLYGDFGSSGVRPVKNHSLMEFTGLKDKNGTEIYEGDILTGFGFLAPGTKMPVIFHQEHAQFVCSDGNGVYYFSSPSDAKFIEVIGNIHQHPELLE